MMQINPDRTYPVVRKKIDILERSIKDKRERGVLDRNKKHTYHIFKWVFSGKTLYNYCEDKEWKNHPGRKMGVMLHETYTF